MSQGGPVKGIGAIDPRMSANGRRFMISASALATLVMCLCLTGSVFALAASAEVARDEKPDDRAPHSSKDRVSVASNSRIPGSYIVVLNESVAHPGATARQQVAQRDGDLGFVYQELNGYSVSDLSKGDAGALRADPRVNYVAPDHKVKVLSQTTPTGISRIFANENPFMDIDGVDDVRINADVAVIDVGVDASHPDLNVVERTDCSAGPPCVNGSGGYGGGHGTHVAGIVGAIDNGVGVVGVAPGARIWAVKVLDEEGYGSASNDIAGIEWVTAHASQIEVANMSIGFEGRSVPEEEAIEKSIEAGVVYAVAASNDSYNAEGVYPANDPDVLTVSNLVDYDGKPGGLGSSTCRDRGPDDTLATSSNWGGRVDIAAPGICIYSTWPGGKYEYDSGTSMASPHVAGAAAVLASKSNPNSKQDVEAIRQTLINEGSLGWKDTSEDTKAEPALYMGGTPLTQTEIATAGASSTDGKSASLNGAINPRGLETTYKFEYGTTTGYGQSAPATPNTLSAGTKYTTVSQAIGGLKPEQTYHYRLSATNSSGTTYGSDRTVTPSAWFMRTPSIAAEKTGAEWLNDVSCVSPTSCMAVGYDYNNENRVISYEQLGDSWVWHPVPTPSGGEGPELEGVSCTASNACTAVGYAELSGGNKAFAVRWNGSSWSTQSVPLPSGALFSYLTDVSCMSSTECLASGYYMNAAEKWVNYSALWKVGAWSTQSVPNAVDSAESELDDVSCASSTSCKAVGWYVSTGGVNKPVIVAWNGSSWSLQTTARSSGQLSAVSCASAEFCVAASSLPTIEKWDGTKWTTQTAPLPAGIAEGYVEGVSCIRSTYCMMAGYARTSPRTTPLLEAWNGSSWTAQIAPRDAEARHRLWGISCAGIGDCAGVGDARLEQTEALIESRKAALTRDATSIFPAQATLNGSINPGGVSTTYRFEYGTTTSYGTKTAEGSAGSGTEVVDVSAPAVELSAHTTYHYRLVASNTSGTSYGDDRTFKTATIAHQFEASFSGSGENELDSPWGLDIDASGNFWVADLAHNRVEEFNSKGEFLFKFGSTGSGNGQFKEPVDVAVMANGDMWVTDAGNARVQKFNSKGEYLSQFNSSGAPGGKFVEPWGIDVGPNGHIWVSDNRYYRVEEFDAGGAFLQEVHGAGQGGTGNAEFAGPKGIAIDTGGNVWVADSDNNRVQELSSSGAFLSKFGTKGTGNGQFEFPQAIDIKESGALLVVDRWTGRVQEFTPQAEYLAQFGGEQLIEPRGLATGPQGAVYVTNTYKDRVERWQEPIPEAITQAVSGIHSTEATLNGTVNPRGVSTTYRFEYGPTISYGSSAPVPSESVGSGVESLAKSQAISGLKVGTTYHFRIVAANSEGTTYGADKTLTTLSATPIYQSSFGSSGTGNGQFAHPAGSAVDGSGNLWVVDENNDRVEKFNSTGGYLTKFGSAGTGNGQFGRPTDVAIDAKGNLWVTDAGNGRVEEFNSSGEYLTKFGSVGTGNGQFGSGGPEAITIDSKGNIWVADTYNGRLQKFNEKGEFVKVVSSKGSGVGFLGEPTGIDIGLNGNVWVADWQYNRVVEFNEAGEYIRQFGSEGTGNGQFKHPDVVEVDSNGGVWVGDQNNSRVEKFTEGGEYVTKFGTAGSGTAQFSFGYPMGISSDTKGNLWVSDTNNNRVQKWGY